MGARTAGAAPAPSWDDGLEPDLESVLSDPIVGLVMDRDGLTVDEVAIIARRTRDRLRTHPVASGA